MVGSLGQPQFLFNWVNYDPTTYNSAAFFRDVSGVVHLRGVVTDGTGVDIFQLPAGCFPAKAHDYAATTTTSLFRKVRVTSSGRVRADAPPTAPISLEGISFRATG